jgi:hypothetical protein
MRVVVHVPLPSCRRRLPAIEQCQVRGGNDAHWQLS